MDTALPVFVPTHRNVARILPEQLLSRVISLSQAESDISWEIGRVANEVYAYCLANHKPYSKISICAWLAREIDGERGMNTILKYSEVTAYYTYEEQVQYSNLPFSHFKYAMRMRDKTLSLKVLEYSWALTLKHDHAPSVKQLQSRFEPEVFPASERSIGGFDLLEEGQVDGITPAVASVTNWSDETPVGELREALDTLRRNLEVVRQSDPRLAQLLAQISLLCDQALEEIELTPVSH